MGEEHSRHVPNEAAAHEERRARAELVDRLFREHNEALIRFLQARLRSPQEAHEVAQEAYVRLLSLDEPGAVSYLRAFLFKTAANLAVDRLRREDLHLRATALPLFHEFADVRTPERRAAAAQTRERLERLVAALPEKCRRVFVLHRVHGRDVDSIAREMNLSKRMVQTYIVRALLYCQKGLDLEDAGTKETSND
jgi:RNA polymerase sigma factor (sigma-70 family)